MELISCTECGRPWGVTIELGELPSDERQSAAQRFMEEALVEHLEETVLDPFEAADIDGAPRVEAEEIVWVTEAMASFASEHLSTECIGEVPAWYPIDQLDIPQWLLRGRKRRWAYRWDCCNISLHRIGWAPQVREAG